MFKKTILFMHRWLGFITGLVVFIVCITGCIYCFQDEIQDAMYNYRTVQVQQSSILKPSVLQAAVLVKNKGFKSSLVTYPGRGRAAIVRISNKKDTYSIYVNPYTAQVLHNENLRTNFFVVVEFIHLYLLLPPQIGKLVVGTSVLIFLFIMITGIILWWPKRKTDRKRSFTIKWNGRWRRVNYDLHNVLGFYATSIAIVLAITGLSMSFNWVEKGIKSVANLGRSYPHETRDAKSDSLQKGMVHAIPAMDIAYDILKQKSPDAQMLLLFKGAKADSPLFGTAYAKSLNFGYSDFYQFDQYTGKLLDFMPNSNKSPGEKLSNLNYDIHVGQVLGLTGKIIAFIASLICASLPITGFIIWLGKRKKKKYKKPRAQFAV
jgi:uncharacterized iron-regulated membrane protein